VSTSAKRVISLAGNCVRSRAENIRDNFRRVVDTCKRERLSSAACTDNSINTSHCCVSLVELLAADIYFTQLVHL